MKSRKIVFAEKPKKEANTEKIRAINNSLVELRKSFLYHTKNKSLLAKISHFKKVFHNKVKDSDRVNYISLQLFLDQLEDK